MLFSIAKNSGSHRKLKNTKNISSKAAIIAATVQAVTRIIFTPSIVIVNENNRDIILNVRR